MKYKKGELFTAGFVMAIFLAIMLLIFLAGGGVGTAFDITKFINNVPTFIWVILGIIILFRMLKK